MSWPATLVAVAVGRAVGCLLADLDVNGTKDPEEETRDMILDDGWVEDGMVLASEMG